MKSGFITRVTPKDSAYLAMCDFSVYNSAFGTAADYEWPVRVLSSDAARISYFPQRTLSMLVGGASGATLAVRLRANAMDGKAWANCSLTEAWLIRVSKPLRKVLQFRALPQSAKRFLTHMLTKWASA